MGARRPVPAVGPWRSCGGVGPPLAGLVLPRRRAVATLSGDQGRTAEACGGDQGRTAELGGHRAGGRWPGGRGRSLRGARPARGAVGATTEAREAGRTTGAQSRRRGCPREHIVSLPLRVAWGARLETPAGDWVPVHALRYMHMHCTRGTPTCMHLLGHEGVWGLRRCGARHARSVSPRRDSPTLKALGL